MSDADRTLSLGLWGFQIAGVEKNQPSSFVVMQYDTAERLVQNRIKAK